VSLPLFDITTGTGDFIITKGSLVRRDVDLLARMARETEVWVSLSIPFTDDRTGRAIEPNASLPSQRFETLKIRADLTLRREVLDDGRTRL
jgi:DNA repair photolyase